MKQVIVIGGGASGLMSAYICAERGNDVLLLEKNEKLGKKLYITGKGRCNLTNNCTPDEFLQNVVHGEKFMTSAVHAFSPESTIRWMEERGLAVKTERGNRAFPVSDHASDVIKTLAKACEDVGVKIHLKEPVVTILDKEGKIYGVKTSEKTYLADAVLVCTGGLSYPSTGSTGDGYVWAKNFGHTIVKTTPSLVGFVLKEPVKPLSGLNLKNCTLCVERKAKKIYEELGEIEFSNNSVRGPLALTASALVNRFEMSELTFHLDLKPALSLEKLTARLERDFISRNMEPVKSVLRALLPAPLVPFVLQRVNVKGEKIARTVNVYERKQIVTTVKDLVFHPVSLGSYNEAIVTSGGVETKDVDPKTMESKLVKGLYFCGEVLDIDAFTGGFNIQMAFSTAFMAGNAI